MVSMGNRVCLARRRVRSGREGCESEGGTGAGPGCEADLVGWGLIRGQGESRGVAGGAVVLGGLDVVD